MEPVWGETHLRVGIVEDHEQLREGLRLLIDHTPGFSCTVACGSFEEALPQLADEMPDVALVDIGLPGISGIEGVRILKQRHPAIQVIILTIYDDDERIFQALCAG